MLPRLVGFLIFTIAFGSASSAQTVDPPAATSPITARGRVHWLVRQNLSPASLLEDAAIGAEETLVNSPREYGPHWEGYGKRVGMVAANYGVKTVMEAGLGSIWGEDPRYERTEGESFGSRLGHVVKMTFLARNRSGNLMPAYARFIAIPGSSFLANTWMPDSQATVGDADVRAGLGFLSRMGENAYKEFRPRH
jgi:hypothetical protein